MGHARPKKSWKPRQRSAKAGIKAQALNPNEQIIEHKAAPLRQKLSKKDNILVKVWGTEIPNCIREIPINLSPDSALAWDWRMALEKSKAKDLRLPEDRKKYMTALNDVILPNLLALALSWFNAERTKNPNADELAMMLLDIAWIELLDEYSAHIEMNSGFEKTYLEKILTRLCAVYLTIPGLLLSDLSHTATSAVNCALLIIERLLRLSVLTDKFIPVADLIMSAVGRAFENLPEIDGREKSSGYIKTEGMAEILRTLTKANFMQMNSTEFHLAVAMKATDCLLHYIQILHRHPSFADFRGIIVAQLRHFLKLAEGRALTSRIQERLRTLIKTVEAVALHIEHFRADLQSSTTPARLEIIDKKTRQPWGLEGMKSFL